MIDHAKQLYPINRSLTGDGTRETLEYFENFFPGFERLKYKTGEKSWIDIPQSGMLGRLVEHRLGSEICRVQ